MNLLYCFNKHKYNISKIQLNHKTLSRNLLMFTGRNKPSNDIIRVIRVLMIINTIRKVNRYNKLMCMEKEKHKQEA